MAGPHTLPAELTVYTVADALPRFKAWLDEDIADQGDGPCLRVDAQAVAEVDAAGVQLLLSLANSLTARSCRLIVNQPSAALRAACEALGTSSLLDAPHPMEALP